MLLKTHLAFGLLISFALKCIIGISEIGILVICFSSVLPDIDISSSFIGKRTKIVALVAEHRGFFHTFAASAIFSFAAYIFSPGYAALFFIGYSSHILLDMLNYKGVSAFEPFSSHRTKGFVKTGSITEKAIFAALVLSCIMLFFGNPKICNYPIDSWGLLSAFS